MARPRKFDRAEMLRRAMELFWRYGYEGTTLNDLTDAMGINRPSFYAAFGSKRTLFEEAVALYDSTAGAPASRAVIEAPTARAAVEGMLRANASACAEAGNPPGCMIVLSATIGSPDSEEVRRHLSEWRVRGQHQLRDRLRRAIADGDLPSGADPDGLAAFYTAVLEGLSIQARDGASAAVLHGIVDHAMAAWDALTTPAPR